MSQSLPFLSDFLGTFLISYSKAMW